MTDYIKLWVENVAQIEKIYDLSLLDFNGQHSRKTGDIIEYPITCTWDVFKFELKSATRLEITGSLHKYWNKGTNENDFKYTDIKTAIQNFCTDLNLDPKLAKLINLEIGVNVNPVYSASEIIEDLVCYKNERPLRPYEGRKNHFYFIEFKKGDHYLKVYDKGKQYKTVNTLRIEYKEMRSRALISCGADTLNDLTNIKVLTLLGGKLVQYCKFLVFNDSTLNIEDLSKKDLSKYLIMANPNNWKIKKGEKNSTIYRKEKTFISIVQKYGKRDIYSYIETLVNDKVLELLQNSDCINFLSNYNRKPSQKRYCLTCGRELHPEQKKESKFCSSLFVGEKLAHQCRNRSSNPGNNFKRKIQCINDKGVLFDIMPYFTNIPPQILINQRVFKNY